MVLGTWKRLPFTLMITSDWVLVLEGVARNTPATGAARLEARPRMADAQTWLHDDHEVREGNVEFFVVFVPFVVFVATACLTRSDRP